MRDTENVFRKLTKIRELLGSFEELISENKIIFKKQ